MPAVPLDSDHPAEWFRIKARESKDANQARRLLSLAAIKDGLSRTEAAKIGGMDRQTLRDWVHRFNEDGLDGLKDRHGGGVPRALNEEQTAWIMAKVADGPDPEKDGLVRWRILDLCALIDQEFGITIKETAMSRVLRDHGYRNLTTRPIGRGQDSQALESFKKPSQEP